MRMNFNQEQIISILLEGESGITIDNLCRKHCFAKSTYHKWQAKFGGMSISDATKLKTLEQENNRLKRLVADLSLETIALKDVYQKSGKAYSKTHDSRLLYIKLSDE